MKLNAISASPRAPRAPCAKSLWIMAVLLGNIAAPMPAQNAGQPNTAGPSLEDLMNVDVTSVSKKEQTLSKTGAAVFVINHEDIRRSGAVNIPDLLRMAPGVEVAQVNANQWAISIRGFNAVYSNKLLVMIDGRTLYTDAFSGVFWDQIDVALEDIERIEIIRGPGGTVWGANAVNGVINIITKSAADTKGGIAVAGSGTSETAQGFLQYGGDMGASGAYRVFGKYFNTDNSPAPGGLTTADAWHTAHGGFRFDWGPSPQDTVSVQGDFLAGSGGATTTIDAGNPPVQSLVDNRLTNNSGDILAGWDHTLANGATTSFHIYDNITGRNQDGVRISDNTLNAEFENHFQVGSRNDIVWGLDYRFSRAELRPFTGYGAQVNPPLTESSLFAAFLQDEIRIAKSVSLVLGSKVEHNSYTGFENSPSAQVVWNENSRHTLWASASRAIREPDILEHGVSYNVGVVPVPGIGDALLVVNGNPKMLAETLQDYETGYRSQLNARVSLDVTGFLSFYHHLATNEPGRPYVSFGPQGPIIIEPVNYGNLAHARDYGIEVFANLQALRRWKVSPGFSVLRMFLETRRGSSLSYVPCSTCAEISNGTRASSTSERLAIWVFLAMCGSTRELAGVLENARNLA